MLTWVADLQDVANFYHTGGLLALGFIMITTTTARYLSYKSDRLVIPSPFNLEEGPTGQGIVLGLSLWRPAPPCHRHEETDRPPQQAD